MHCLIIYLLAKHQHVQDKMRAEIIAAGKGGDIPYDQLVDLPYMDAVCRETLRLCVFHFRLKTMVLTRR